MERGRRERRRRQEVAMLMVTEERRKGGSCTGSVCVQPAGPDVRHQLHLALVHQWKTHGITCDVTRTCGGRHGTDTPQLS